MRKVLHILTKGNDVAASEVISGQHGQSDCEVKMVTLATGEPDYMKLLEDIFAADSVAVW